MQHMQRCLKGWSANLNGETKRQIAQLHHQLQEWEEVMEQRDLLPEELDSLSNLKADLFAGHLPDWNNQMETKIKG